MNVLFAKNNVNIGDLYSVFIELLSFVETLAIVRYYDCDSDLPFPH